MNKVHDSFSFLTATCYKELYISDFILLDIAYEKEGMLKIMWSTAFQSVFQFTTVKHEYAENHFSVLLHLCKRSPGSISKFLLSFALFLKKSYFKKTTKSWQTQTCSPTK